MSAVCRTFTIGRFLASSWLFPFFVNGNGRAFRFGLRYIPGAVSNIPALECYLDARPALCVSNIPALEYYLAKVKVSEMNRFNSFQTQSSLGRYAHLWYKATPTYFSTENSNAFYGTHLSTQHPTTNQHERTRRRRRGKRRLLWRHQ